MTIRIIFLDIKCYYLFQTVDFTFIFIIILIQKWAVAVLKYSFLSIPEITAGLWNPIQTSYLFLVGRTRQWQRHSG
jgi:hypothetical protein